MAKGTFEAGGSGPDSIGDVLLNGSTGGDTLQGRDMGPHVFNGEETQGGAYRVLASNDE